MKWLIKYLNLYACNRIRTITADTESKNGTAPTENTSAGETGVKVNSNRNGIRLTATAITLHFNSGQWKMVSSYIIINRINISPLFFKYIWNQFLSPAQQDQENHFLHQK